MPSPKDIQVAIVILNWNGKKYLEKFLPVLQNNLPSFAKIVIADNQSSDDSVAFMTKVYPQIETIINSGNEGFAKGYNLALEQIKTPYYILLNSDIEVTPNWIEPLYDLMESDPSIGVCQPKILSYDKKTHFEYAGAAGGFIDYMGFPFCRGRLFADLEEDLGQYDSVEEIFWATGAAMMVRSKIYWEAGGLDEDFFAHQEEIDLCWRIKNLGYKIMYTPLSKIYHIGGGTLPKHNPLKPYLNFRNNLIMLVKNLPTKNLFPNLLYKMILDGMAALKFLTEKDPIQAYAVFRAHVRFYITLPKTLKKRRHIQRTIKNKDLPRIYKRSIVRQYFFQSKRKFSELKPSDFA
jgi:GT2 family glycosyltransferase